MGELQRVQAELAQVTEALAHQELALLQIKQAVVAVVVELQAILKLHQAVAAVEFLCLDIYVQL